MSRLTKQIRLVLISSSLALAGCGRNPESGSDCQQRPPGDGKLPPVCGPVGGHGTGYHGYGHHYWGWGGSSVDRGGGGASGFAGHSGTVIARGGFGSFGHGVGS